MLKDAINRRLRLYFGVLFNMVFLDVLKLIFAVFVAFLFGKLVSKLKLPAILGWLLAGMTLGPHALGLLNEPMMEAAWYTTAESILECVRQANRCHDHHRIPGDISGRQPGVRRHFWDNGRAVVPGIPVRRYRFSHSTSPVTFHCE